MDVFNKLVSGVKDYAQKNGFKKAVLGLSGGIDSSLTACIAVNALGKENVVGVLMPSAITSKASNEDAIQLAKNLGITYKIIPISRILDIYVETLKKEFMGLKTDATEENIQARIRANILMALSNKFGYLVLATGNKSELYTGYCTLYGDLAGGLAPIADIFKTMVYELTKFVNRNKEVIPNNIITKEPTAELRPGQKDSDNLPPYESLDKILKMHVEERKGKNEIVDAGFYPGLVEDVLAKVKKSEFKRMQAPQCIKITP